MRIAIEAQRIFRKNKHGMDFVVLEMLRELQKLDKVNEYFVFVSPGEDRCLEDTRNMHIIELKMPSYPLWEQIALPRAVKNVRAELLHCTSNTAPLYCSVPLMITLHDIIFLEKRHGITSSWYQKLGWYYRRWNVPRILPKCKKVITVSNFERDNIIHKTKIDSDRIVTVYNGYSNHFNHKENWKEFVSKYTDKENYFLFLGNTDPKKNTPRVLEAYSQYLRETSSPSFLMIADLKEEAINALIQEHDLSNIMNHIIIPGYIQNTDLPYIYSGAKAFLYPSLRESFGIPLLEAMACGTPVISSCTSAIPEVAGDGAILVDPTDTEAIKNELIKIETDSEYRQRMIEKGLLRSKRFNWENTAKEVLSLYKELAQN